MKNEKGITLIALSITIIVLIIIASVAVNTGFGTIKFAKFNKAKSEIELIQLQVNTWYDEYKSIETEEGKANYLENIGLETTDTTCDQNTLETTPRDTELEYRYLSKNYLRNILGMDLENEFLINIPNRKVIIFGGITYENKTYYTPEDFGIINVKSEEPVSGIEFNISQGNNTDIVISDLKFKDTTGNVTNISKFIVQYKNSTDSDWKDVTFGVIKFNDEEDNNKIKYKFAAPEKDTATYDVKISTIDKNITQTDSIFVKSQWVLATFDANGGVVDTNTKYVKMGEKYGELPTPTRDGYTFKGWNGKNVLNISGLTHYDTGVTFEGDSITFNTSFIENNVVNAIQIQKRMNGEYIGSISTDYTIGDGKIYTFTKDSSFNQLYLKLNGSKKDAGIYIENILQDNKNYSISFNFDRLIVENSLATISNLQIEEGLQATQYETYYVTPDTKVTQNNDDNYTLTAIWEENS